MGSYLYFLYSLQYAIPMARQLRIEYEGAVYHITSRGNAGQGIFLDDADREGFLDVLASVVDRFNWICHAYCLMTNHYHLLLETPDANLSRGMRQLNGVYTQAFNRQRGRKGHVLQGRFKSILVEKDSYLLELARYVVLNPVRASMVQHPRHWRWSSYRATAGEIVAPDFLTTEWILSQFEEDPDRARRAYRVFVKEGHGVRVWEDLQGGILLGADSFVEKVKPLLKDRVAIREIPRRERLAARPSLDELFTGVLNNKAARNESIYKAVRVHEYTLAEVQDFLGLHYSTISIIAKRVAEKREHQK